MPLHPAPQGLNAYTLKTAMHLAKKKKHTRAMDEMPRDQLSVPIVIVGGKVICIRRVLSFYDLPFEDLDLDRIVATVPS